MPLLTSLKEVMSGYEETSEVRKSIGKKLICMNTEESKSKTDRSELANEYFAHLNKTKFVFAQMHLKTFPCFYLCVGWHFFGIIF